MAVSAAGAIDLKRDSAIPHPCLDAQPPFHILRLWAKRKASDAAIFPAAIKHESLCRYVGYPRRVLRRRQLLPAEFYGAA